MLTWPSDSRAFRFYSDMGMIGSWVLLLSQKSMNSRFLEPPNLICFPSLKKMRVGKPLILYLPCTSLCASRSMSANWTVIMKLITCGIAFFEFGSEFNEDGSQFFAMSAPRSIELDKEEGMILNGLREGGISQLQNTIVFLRSRCEDQ